MFQDQAPSRGAGTSSSSICRLGPNRGALHSISKSSRVKLARPVA
jgi:hypothetical protein